jgi:hypothetical protein
MNHHHTPAETPPIVTPADAALTLQGQAAIEQRLSEAMADMRAIYDRLGDLAARGVKLKLILHELTRLRNPKSYTGETYPVLAATGLIRPREDTDRWEPALPSLVDFASYGIDRTEKGGHYMHTQSLTEGYLRIAYEAAGRAAPPAPSS